MVGHVIARFVVKDQVKSSLVFGDIAYTVRIRCSDSGIFHAPSVTVAH